MEQLIIERMVLIVNIRHSSNLVAGGVSMRESYDTFCIPVFGNPQVPMGNRNNYSCDFVNHWKEKTAFVVLHDDRPPDAPKCCIIGRPFHAPPVDFAENMPVKWMEKQRDGISVAWHAVHDVFAGIFNYGFNTITKRPHAFYMKGVPWIAQWMWQPFYNFVEETPSESLWDVPVECATAIACPGWG